jgi:hypothetical protein
MEGSLSRFLCNSVVPDKLVTHQLTLITSKRSDPKTPKRGRSLSRLNPGFTVEVGDVVLNAVFLEENRTRRLLQCRVQEIREAR